MDYGYCDVPQTYEFHGIGQYNLSYVDFAFFAGCETAKGTSNITKYANTKGAKASLGWKVSVNDYDAYIWTQRFYNRLAGGYTISQSITYANSFSDYYTTTPKQTQYYGNSGQVLNSIGNEMYNVNESIDMHLGKKYDYDLIANKNKDIQITNKLNLINKDFDSNDYIKEITTNNDSTIYDYRFTINGIKTNIGYTVIMEDGKNNINIIDNTSGYNLESLKAKKILNLKKLESNIKTREIKEKALKVAASNYSDESRDIINEYEFYDVKEDKLYYVVEVKVTDPIFNTSSVMLHREEIK